MRTLRIGLLLAVGLATGAASPPTVVKASPIAYYVAKNGNDSWSGTAAAYVSGGTGPFLTIQKCASVAQAGDTCIVRAGTYRETVKPANSGTAAAAITFQPYENESVTISETDDLTSGWTPKSGSPGVYQKTVALNPDLFANQVFVDCHMMMQARWPNTSSDMLAPTLATAGTGTGTGTTNGKPTETIFDSNLPSFSLNDANVWIMGSYGYTAHTGTVMLSSSGQITFNAPSDNCGDICAVPGNHYYLYGLLSFLDAPSEWHYDSGSQTLYLKTPDSASPSSHASVEVKQRNYAFDLGGRSYIRIKGFNLFAASLWTDGTSTYNVIDGIHAQYVSHYMDIVNDPDNGGPYGSHVKNTGIILDGSHNTLKNSTIAYSAGNGISQLGRYNVITNNLIHDTDYSGTYTSPVRIKGDETDVTVTYNTIYRTGRDGITGGTGNNRIAYNNVYDFGRLNADLGGYYTCCKYTDGTGTSIDHNWVHDNQSGVAGVGIYIDNGASNFLIHHNVAWNNGIGIKLNGISSGNSLGNLVYNNTLGSGQPKSIGSVGVTNSTGTALKNNIFRGSTDSIAGGSVWQFNLPSSTDPLFASAASGNFHLQSGSPAIDAGTVISGITDGYSGAAPDQGAYEYGQLDWVPGCNFNGYGQSCSSTNLLTNPGFEQGTSGWTAAGGSITTATDAHSGTSSLKVYNRTGTTNSARQGVAINNGQTYTFSAWAKLGTGSDTAYLTLQYTVGGTTYWKRLASVAIGASDWAPLSRVYTFDEVGPISSAYLYVETNASTADLYVDDVYADSFKTKLN